MKTHQEVVAFDQALEGLTALPEADIIAQFSDLLLAFDDACEYIEVMWGLIHFIEHYGLDTEVRAFGEVAPQLLDQAPEWVGTIFIRILNHEESRLALGKLLPTLPTLHQENIKAVLENLVAEYAERRTQVDGVYTNMDAQL